MQENDHCGRINYIRGGFCITLTDLQNKGARYFVMVTHAHLNKEDHAASAHIFVEMEKRYNPEGLPSFFLGDFNAHEKDACYPTYQAYWTDAYHAFDTKPELREGPEGTYNGWDPESVQNPETRIDFVFFRGRVEPLRYECDSTLFDGYCASDHFPVILDCKVK
jgi:endonuclease/exonuclease/phosphatase family metal-dependent hydrolase